MRTRLAAALATVLWMVGACADALPLPVGWQPEGPIDCHVELSSKTVGLMQRLDFTLWSYIERQAEPPLTEPPVPPGFAGNVQTGMRRLEKGWLVRRVFQLRPTKLGPITIESMKVGFDDQETTTPAVSIEVTSVLGSDHDPKAVEDPAAPFAAEMSLTPFLIGAAGLVILGLLIWWWRRRSRRTVAWPVEVPLPPHVKAMRALERLRQSERQTEVEIESFYVGVSDVLRVYLEDRFGLHAPLRSTEEFLLDIEAGDDLSLSQRQSLKQFLQQCDLVKFARMFPDLDVHEQTLRIAEAFVEQTRGDVIQDGDAGAEPLRAKVGGAA